MDPGEARAREWAGVKTEKQPHKEKEVYYARI
jgi:hypothetical protein